MASTDDLSPLEMLTLDEQGRADALVVDGHADGIFGEKTGKDTALTLMNTDEVFDGRIEFRGIRFDQQLSVQRIEKEMFDQQ